MPLLTAAVLLIPIVCWQGNVLSHLWGWFAVPLGLVPLSIAHALGLCVLVKCFAGTTYEEGVSVEIWEDVLVFLVKELVVPAVALGVGWLFQAAM